MLSLAGWQNFYVIIGSSAGALIGLQFVVITLIADTGHGDVGAGRAFTTPTIVHLGVDLLLAAVTVMPWHSEIPLRLAWAAVGIAGLVYSAIIARCMVRLRSYRPQREDWLFHVALPALGYFVFALSAALARGDIGWPMLATAGAVLLLLFVGIHNAWDAVTYHVFTRIREQLPTQNSSDGKLAGDSPARQG